MRTIFAKEESFAGTMERVACTNELMEERNRVSRLLRREKNIGPTVERIRLMIREAIASIAP